MRRPVRITTPFLSLEEAAKLIGIPPRRARRIAALVAAEPSGDVIAPIRIGAIRKAAKRARTKRKARR